MTPCQGNKPPSWMESSRLLLSKRSLRTTQADPCETKRPENRVLASGAAGTGSEQGQSVGKWRKELLLQPVCGVCDVVCICVWCVHVCDVRMVCAWCVPVCAWCVWSVHGVACTCVWCVCVHGMCTCVLCTCVWCVCVHVCVGCVCGLWVSMYSPQQSHPGPGMV